ncbi:ABC transporter ATP-binding protein [Methylicorpusculum sp.]|uniref:ABC transporter ATP-binding protein n=1 Tax=Methylicorpusculum sp. TaxID=2713644 RepID=UPI00271C998B|nr:ABC transporter ATP-binding protein [Methylicorpusculum sp.]MDO8844871.1 ABC transporter ATP-binding protein [Methylicorpusculum sp.]MDO9240204.1 ABC transporter ATP-binding protein [Methylicorpusculum sp.]MDP2180550.1 ABC transporter ATP-binding protein [Methylicorpusculum sp.]MDP3527710.1 ABC transporter ATP-binding protein [Methylicorpusculum sp.]MDZ4153796.1 ABC transporter ATP-binding protein [Methylicorpusculum sp.]
MKLIEAENLYRYYGKHCAVHDLSFSLARGDVLGFLGPNGAGKTTTMQMLCGNLAPSAGRIIINGHDLLDSPVAAKRNIGYLPDTPPLYRELTVDEFLSYCAQLHQVPRDQIKPATTTAKEKCGLTSVSDRLIAHLSKGYQQRVGIAQAILHSPDIIILDEPTVGLDPIQIREIRSLIRELGQAHGVILSTHILSEVQESCTHVQIIQEGRLILHETIKGLEQHMKMATVELTTRIPVNADLLKSLSGVLSIEILAPCKIQVHYDSSHDPSEQIASLTIAQGWGLQEISPIKRSMEDIFIALTQAASDNSANTRDSLP